MRSLKQYIIESSTNNFFDELDYKISYREDWGKDGTHYTKRIKITCTPEQLKKLNELIWNSKHVQNSPSGIKYKKEDIELKEGDNFSCLSVSKAFETLNGQSPHVVGQHNTVFRIKLLN